MPAVICACVPAAYKHRRQRRAHCCCTGLCVPATCARLPPTISQPHVRGGLAFAQCWRRRVRRRRVPAAGASLGGVREAAAQMCVCSRLVHTFAARATRTQKHPRSKPIAHAPPAVATIACRSRPSSQHLLQAIQADSPAHNSTRTPLRASGTAGAPGQQCMQQQADAPLACSSGQPPQAAPAAMQVD